MRVPFLLCRRLVAPGNGIVRQPDRGCSLGGAERPRCGEERGGSPVSNERKEGVRADAARRLRTEECRWFESNRGSHTAAPPKGVALLFGCTR